MTRNITSSAWEQLRIQTRDKQFAVLLTIVHPSMADTLRFVCDVVDMVSRGNTFVGFPFDFEITGDSEKSPQLKLNIGNIDRRISDALLDETIPATVTLEVVLREEPDTVIRSIKYLKLIAANVSSSAISGTLVLENRGTEPCFSITGTKARFPGLWFR